jgi:hypothetical protein
MMRIMAVEAALADGAIPRRFVRIMQGNPASLPSCSLRLRNSGFAATGASVAR